MKKPGRNSYIIIALTAFVLLGVGGAFVVEKLLRLDSYKDQILSELQRSLNRSVQYDKGTFSFGLAPSFSFTNVVVKERGGATNFVTTEKLTFRVALLPLLEKRIMLKEMALDRPVISLYRDGSGTFNVSDLLEEKKEGGPPLQVKGIRIKKGTVRFVDLAASPGPVSVGLEEMDLSLNRLVRGKTCGFKFSAHIAGEAKKGTISLSGSAVLPGKDQPLRDTRVTATVLAKNLNAEQYWPYYARFVPFKKVLGLLDVDSVFKGKLTDFTSKGSIKISGLHFDYPQVFHSVLTPQNTRFSYDMSLTPRDISVKAIDLSMDGLRVKGSCSILDIPSGDPRIVARATTSTFRLQDFYRYIPYGIIVKDTSEFIEQRIKGGIYKLEDGRLDGRVSQIVHMEKGENYNILAIRGKVEQGLVAYASGVPSFNNIKGELEIRGKDFLLHQITGNFGGSPFSLEGRIADYPLDKPSSYPFVMDIAPRPAEVAWLLGKKVGKKLTFSGDSRLRLIGGGTTGAYQLSGDWNLTSAAYSYPDFIAKPLGRPNLLSFKGSLNKQEARLDALRYNLSPVALVISAKYGYAGKSPFTLGIESNQFQVNEVAPYLPAIKKYQPSGKAQVAMTGESPNANVEDLQWDGDIRLTALSFKPSEQIKPVTMTGTVNFSGTSLETSQIVAKLGSSTIYCKGTLADFKHPAMTLAFSAPSLDMADLGLHAPQKEVRALKVQGNVSLKDNSLQIKSLSGQIGNTTASIKGTVQDLANPMIDIAVISPHLELDDLMLLMSMQKAGKKEGPPGRVAVKASVHAETARLKDIDVEKLSAAVILENGILYLQPFEAGAFGGHVSGKGRFDFGANDAIPRYQLSYSLEKVSADRLFQALGVRKHQVTGSLSAQGDLTAKGKNSVDLKKSALGSFQLRCEKGSLRKFPIFSKIFSILNVSQLLKFHLPDMISGGMPYNSITATVSVQDGMATSQDLYIASEAMNISAVGKIDLVREEVDATIGVQPLQTVDKVVNRIPVVGWILTGGKKTFLTTYFEAKGKLLDPVVKAIPVRSMAKGVLNIFKRVFELPSKLITDTGEVLIGK